MLQQTQVSRVVPKFVSFLKRFPNLLALSRAPLSAVLTEWQGLGYNRRAKMLHDAAQACMIYHTGHIPNNYADLVALPGVGQYTARAIMVFAYNEPEVLIETNVRSVFIHHFFPRSKKVEDDRILKVLAPLVPKAHARAFYSALMDYGTYLKSTVSNPSRKSAHHTKQKPFKGSDREIRGALVRLLSSRNATIDSIRKELMFEEERIKLQLGRLEKEEIITQKGRIFRLR